ncbi:MAG: right-handed parallel beta-helix repeat-containing protein [Sedimentisphaeraceae bacterium JB056]
MSQKTIEKKILPFLAVLCAVNFLIAGDYYFNDSAGDHDWNNTSNWIPAQLPSDSDIVYFDEDYEITGNYCLIADGDSVTCSRLRMSSLGSGSKQTYIKMTGGTLHAKSGISLGNEHFYDDSFYAARFEQFNGEVICDDFWRVGYRSGLSQWYLLGGTVTCNRLLLQADDAATYSRIYIGDGTFSVKYDRVAEIESYFGSSILPYEGLGQLYASYDPDARDGIGQTTVRRFVQASTPVPYSGQSGVAFDVLLQWDSGSSDVTSNLYFGDDYDSVVHADTNSPQFYGNVTTDSYQLSNLRCGGDYYWRVDLVWSDGFVVRGTTWSFTVNGLFNGLDAAASGEYSDIREAVFAVDGSGLSGESHISQNNYSMWQDSEIAEFPKWFRIDLGKSRLVKELKIWNYNWSGYTDRGIKNIDVLTADRVDSPGNPIENPQAWTLNKTNVIIPQAPGNDDYDSPEIVDIDDAQCRWIALRINGSWGGGYGGISEVQVSGEDLLVSSSPLPLENAVGVDTDITLQWQNGEGLVESQIIYFGTDYQQVLNASDPYTSPSQGIYSTNEFSPSTMNYSSDYYWRVDQLLTSGTIVQGPVWSFRTRQEPVLPQKAIALSPKDGGFLSVYDKLGWTEAVKAESYDVYLGESYTEVYNADNVLSDVYIGTIAGDSIMPENIDYGKQYYWRIDCRNSVGVTTGDIWQFTTFTAPAFLDEYYVSPDGSDNNSGTSDMPFATLQRARDAVRYSRENDPSRNITVWLMSGQYNLTKSLELGIADSGTGPYRVTYSSAPGHKASVNSDVSIIDWQPLAVSEQPEGLPESASGNLWVADLPQQAGDFKILYDGDNELPRAQAPGFIPLDVDDDHKSKTRLYCPQGVLSDWDNIEDVELVIRADVPYSMQILPVKSVDTSSNVLTTLYPATYYLLPLRHTDQPVVDQSVWIENVPQGMTQPGRWFTDTAKGKVYLWPLLQSEPQNISAPALCNYVSVEGQESLSVAARNITFRRIRFERSDRYEVVGDQYSEQVQHGWDFYDSNNAMVRFRWASSCKIDRCQFDGAASAVRMDQYARMIEVSNCNMDNIGGTGIFICGPDDSRLINQYNKIYNNRIINPGRKYWNGHGVLVYQSQNNFIQQNLVADTPYTAITITGSRDITTSHNNLVEGNEVYNTCTMLGDGNGIYLRYAGLGNVVRGNYIHHIYAAGAHGGIRCDDYQANVTLENNIIHKCAYTGIIIKEYNVVRNNIIFDLYQPGDSGFDWGIEPRGFLLLRPHTTSDNAVISNNIFYNSGQAVNFYEDESNKLSTCVVDNNLFYTLNDTNFTNNYLASVQAVGVDLHSVAADPIFSELSSFKLDVNSPVFALGFDAIEFDQIGLRVFSDLNRDMIVDNEDFAVFAEGWLSSDLESDIGPIGGDRLLDVYDILMLADYWMD